MGCGCGGAQPPSPARTAAQKRTPPEPKTPRRGGPGQRGYYWEGPKGRPKPAADA